MVQGSDSTQEFRDNCQLTCKKRCTGAECKNMHRRINIYRNYVDKNFDSLSKEYLFLGGVINTDNQTLTEEYVKEKNTKSSF
jgi:hypothetical protein